MDTNFEPEQYEWYGQYKQTDEASIHDKGQGEPIVLRLFEFQFPPNIEKLPTKDDLLTPDYMRYLHNTLWADGLRMVLEPRVSINNEGCKIFVPAQARTGQSFLEEAKLLQEYI